jgi:flagellar basal-body rod protein FlgG
VNPALWIAKTGLDAQQTRMGVLAHNLANVNTTGFKRGQAIFEDLLYQNFRQVGAPTSDDTILPSGLSLGTGVRLVATQKIFNQGNSVKTDNPLDMAVQGRGFFQVLRPDGSLGYTRAGSFQTNADGQVVTASGYLLQPAITIPANVLSITVAATGGVSVQQPGTAQPTEVGSIQIADFINPTGLEPIGDNLFLESASSGAPQVNSPGSTGLGTLGQGVLETSNVNVVEELVNMIETQRAYEVNSKAIASTDEMLQFVNNTL